ncbi:metalloregulator ArsR/SmtB family transcription factor [Actinomycetospora endophytica]|uniref:Metalloregulator ArsR/SmtB family transcription factor n=1 Tax=Actinomycetospora endophytica TaxID=2291215 RepID=A0ABS8PH26_9PSEU|nr:metalloregulator ArsR/SmtB family transcription factor [Actinomycetospora endophytica]MCD2197553.1 metalloregulator ArsR/SmtB family transcription factor [Actinomycetospora endophytica]
MEPNENLAFDALSDRVRRRILAVLGEQGELSVGDIAQRIDAVGRTTVSSHLRVLRTSGLVRERRDGRNRFYSLDADGAVRDAFVFLQSILRQGVEAVENPGATSGEDPPGSARQAAG